MRHAGNKNRSAVAVGVPRDLGAIAPGDGVRKRHLSVGQLFFVRLAFRYAAILYKYAAGTCSQTEQTKAPAIKQKSVGAKKWNLKNALPGQR